MTLCRYYKIRPGKRTVQALEWVQGYAFRIFLAERPKNTNAIN
jgi:hypothetical protein